MSITLIIIITTVITSVLAFQDQSRLYRLMFSPYQVAHYGEWYRFISSGFVHAGWLHLGLNMYVLYIFSGVVEAGFQHYFGKLGHLLYLLMYFAAIVVSSLFAFFRHKDNPNYASLGASGAVAAVVFASILIYPTGKIGLLLLPVMFPSWIFGILYLLYSYYMAKKQVDNIGHDAHFIGAVFGFVFPLLFKPGLFVIFLHQISSSL